MLEELLLELDAVDDVLDALVDGVLDAVEVLDEAGVLLDDAPRLSFR